MCTSARGSAFGGLDVTARGAGAFGWIDPPYTDAGLWPAYVVRFRANESAMDKIEAPDMQNMQALTLCGYRDIWFAGRPYGPDMGNVIVNYYRGKWFYHPDPSPYGMKYLHLFSHTNGWGFDENRIYRFNGQSWTLWLELGAFQSIKPCEFKSQTNVWAVGYFSDKSRNGSAVLHYNGASWEEAFAPGENKYVYDVSMYTNNNGWAVGAEKMDSQYYGRTWQCVNSVWLERVCPVVEAVHDVEVVSTIEAWALTYDEILHYQTESTVTPTSFGRIKSLFAEGRGSDSTGPPARASRVPYISPPTSSIKQMEANSNSTRKAAKATD